MKAIRTLSDIENLWNSEEIEAGTIWLPQSVEGRRSNFNKTARDFFAKTTLLALSFVRCGEGKPNFSKRSFGWWNKAKEFWGNKTPHELTQYFDSQIRKKERIRVTRGEFLWEKTSGISNYCSDCRQIDRSYLKPDIKFVDGKKCRCFGIRNDMAIRQYSDPISFNTWGHPYWTPGHRRATCQNASGQDDREMPDSWTDNGNQAVWKFKYSTMSPHDEKGYPGHFDSEAGETLSEFNEFLLVKTLIDELHPHAPGQARALQWLLDNQDVIKRDGSLIEGTYARMAADLKISKKSAYLNLTEGINKIRNKHVIEGNAYGVYIKGKEGDTMEHIPTELMTDRPKDDYRPFPRWISPYPGTTKPKVTLEVITPIGRPTANKPAAIAA